MIDTLIHDLTEPLRAILAAPGATEDDFVRLASAGEPLRRALALAETSPQAARSTLDAYLAAIAAFQGAVPASLTDDAKEIAAELVAFTQTPAEQRDPAEALALVLELDAVVSTVVAAERTGRVASGTAEALGVQLEEKLSGATELLPELAQDVENRWLTVGHDPELPAAYGWLDTLAAAAPSRVRVFQATQATARSESLKARALALLARPRPRERVLERFAVLPPEMLVPRFMPQAHFATAAAALPPQVCLVEDDELSIFVEETAAGPHLVIAFVAPLWIDAVAASVDGAPLVSVDAGAREFRFALPVEGEQIRIDLRLDDEHVVHELRLRHGS